MVTSLWVTQLPILLRGDRAVVTLARVIYPRTKPGRRTAISFAGPANVIRRINDWRPPLGHRMFSF